MINDQLLGYVKSQLSLNMKKETIVANLKLGGWTDADINEAFAVLAPYFPSASAPVSTAVSGAAPNVSQMQTTQTDFSNTIHTRSKKLFAAVIILVLLCALGAGAYAYYSGAFVNLPSLVKDTMKNSQTIKSSNYDVTFNVDFSELKIGNSPLDSLSTIGINSKQLTLALNGSSDISDIKNPKFSSIVSFTVGGAASVEFEIRLIDKTFYGRLTKNPTLGNFPISSATISPYVNKWFSFKIPDIPATGSSISALPSTNSGIASTLTDEQKNQLQKMFQDANLIKTLKKLDTETVGGELSYHFSFDLDKEGILSYVQSIIGYIKTNIAKDNPMLLTFSFDPNAFSKAFDQIKDFKGEMWIGRNDKLVHKIAINFGIQPDPTKNEQVKVDVVGILSNYNQPVQITAPAESTPFASLIPPAPIKSAPPKVKVK